MILFSILGSVYTAPSFDARMIDLNEGFAEDWQAELQKKARGRDISTHLCAPCTCLNGFADCSAGSNTPLNLTSIPVNLPPNITVLRIVGQPMLDEAFNNISRYPWAKTLQKLYIGAMPYLTRFPDDFFKSLPQLQYVNAVQSLKIISQDGLFDPVINANMTFIAFCLNSLTIVTNQTWTNLPLLSILCFSYNRVTLIEAGAFSTLTSLKTLLLGVNKLTEIPRLLFSNLPKLDLVDFPINLINKPLPVDLFAGSTALTAINFYDNKIPFIHNSTFARLYSVTQLQGHSNSLTSLGEDLFTDMTLLIELDFYNNVITIITANTFRGLSNLNKVYLGNNSITKVDSMALSFATMLQVVDLSYNSLSEVPLIKLSQSNSTVRKYLLHNNAIVSISPNMSFATVDFLTMDRNPSQCFFFTPPGSYIDNLPRETKCDCASGFYGGAEKNGVSYCQLEVPRRPAKIQLRTESVETFSLSISNIGCIFTPIPIEKITDVRFLSNGEVVIDSAFKLYNKRIDVARSQAVLCPCQKISSPDFNCSTADVSGYPIYKYLDIIPPTELMLTSCRSCSHVWGSTDFLDIPAPVDFHVDFNTNIPGQVVYTFDSDSSRLITSKNLTLTIQNPSPTKAYVNVSAQVGASGQFNLTIIATELLTGDTKVAANIYLNVTDCAPLDKQNSTGFNVCQNGGVCVDNTNPFDGIFECNCSTTDFEGPLCVKPRANLIYLSAAKDSTPTYVGIGVGIAGLVVLILVAIRARRYWVTLEQRKDFHIFISYRTKTDSDIAILLCNRLQEYFVSSSNGTPIKVRCFLDKQDIGDGTEWQKVFCHALAHCCLFVPIISEAGLAPMKNITPNENKEDNVLLEYELAHRYSKEKKLNIFPILVGGGHRGMNRHANPVEDRKLSSQQVVKEFDFAEFGPQCFPSCFSKTSTTQTVTETISYIMSFQGAKLADATVLTFHKKILRRESLDASVPLQSSVKSEATNDLVERILQALNDTAWYNPAYPLCIPGQKNWNSKTASDLPLEGILLEKVHTAFSDSKSSKRDILRGSVAPPASGTANEPEVFSVASIILKVDDNLVTENMLFSVIDSNQDNTFNTPEKEYGFNVDDPVSRDVPLTYF